MQLNLYLRKHGTKTPLVKMGFKLVLIFSSNFHLMLLAFSPFVLSLILSLSFPLPPSFPPFFSFMLWVYVDKIYVAYEFERDDINRNYFSP